MEIKLHETKLEDSEYRCDCGLIILKTSRSNHQKSQKHKKRLLEKQEFNKKFQAFKKQVYEFFMDISEFELD